MVGEKTSAGRIDASHTTGQGPIEIPPVPDSEVTPEDDSLIGKRPRPKRKPKRER